MITNGTISNDSATPQKRDDDAAGDSADRVNIDVDAVFTWHKKHKMTQEKKEKKKEVGP